MLSPYCRTFTLSHLRSFDDAKSYKAFCLIRWPETEGRPTCVRCSHENCWEIRRRRFKCQACRREFSVTTGTGLCLSQNELPRHPGGAVVLGELGEGQECPAALSRAGRPV
ncbi:transposase [Rhizobium sp. 2YAF20]|uniref:transposase n=1 Tax=Rhizobium sp. 2YAF20 TaxID=3233027 RepID=UPI003F94FA9F